MNILRPLTAACLLVLFSSPSLRAVPIKVRVERTKVFLGDAVTLGVYVNGKKLGTVANGQTKILACDNARIGINEAYQTHIANGSENVLNDEEGNFTLKKHYFIVRKSGEEVKLNIGYHNSLSGKGVFKLSTEVDLHDVVKIKRVELDRILKPVVIKESPVYRLAPNTHHVVEDTLTLRHEFRSSTRWKVGADLKAEVNTVWAVITAGISGELERVTSNDFSVETKKMRSVTIQGGSPVKVIWVKYFRTGTAVVLVDGREVRVPFEVDEDFALLTELAP